MNEEIGRLIRTLKDSCKECDGKGLQLRIKDDIHLIDGEEVIQEQQYHYCKRCKELTPIEDKKFDRGRAWKPVVHPEEPEPTRKWDKNKKNGISDSRVDKGKFSKKKGG
jgi:hypothetical protein